MVLRKLIPGSGKYSVEGHSSEFFGLDTVGNLKFSGSPVLLVYYDSEMFSLIVPSHI